MRKLRFDLLVLAATVGVFLPARAQAQTRRICVWSTWRNTCSVVTAQAFKFNRANASEPWKLRITWQNVSAAGLGGDPFEGENSVATRMLINVREKGDLDRALFSEELSVWSSDFEDPPPPGDPSEWDNWELTTKTKGKGKVPYAFNMIGFGGWTGEINNTVRSDGGSCYGVITEWNTSLPCKPDKRDHRELFVGVITYGDFEPMLVNVAAQHQRIYSSNPCPESDPYCESGWAVVPEPITMVLIGTGLAGIGGVAALRRRRENEIENE